MAKVVGLPSDSLALIVVERYGKQLWARCKTRKESRPCDICGGRVMPGSDVYRPITNGYNRMERLHAYCVISLYSIKHGD